MQAKNLYHAHAREGSSPSHVTGGCCERAASDLIREKLPVRSISVVVPAYNESSNIYNTTARLCEVMNETGCNFRIIFVDDGSSDDTWMQISLVAQENHSVTGVKLSRNFGKESAILAGLAESDGDAVVIIDCDLQHPPDIIPKMHQIWTEEKVDVVEGIKESRGTESAIYRVFAGLFYSLINRIGKVNLRDSSDFQLLDRRVVDIIVNLPERQRFFRALSSWVGFTRRRVYFRVEARHGGHSKWNFWKLFKYAITNITSFSTVPLHIVTVFGFTFFIAAVVLGIHTLYTYMTHDAVEGFTTVILLLLIIGSMLMISLGLLGLYVAKIYEEIKGRPVYLVDMVVNYKNKAG